MSEIGEMASTAEPLADSFSTVIDYADSVPALFLANFIGALNAFAEEEGYLLLLSEASSGSIIMRWKMAFAATFSISGLAVAANASEVADFLGKVITAVVSQPADAAPMSPSQEEINKHIMAGLRDGTITSVTLKQKGGRSVRIDATNIAPVAPELPTYRGLGSGRSLPTTYQRYPYGIPTSRVEGRVIIADRKAYFQPSGTSRSFRIHDRRLKKEPLVEGKYLAQGYMYGKMFHMVDAERA